MNVGAPNNPPRRGGVEGVGDAHSTDEPKKGKTWKREGALL